MFTHAVDVVGVVLAEMNDGMMTVAATFTMMLQLSPNCLGWASQGEDGRRRQRSHCQRSLKKSWQLQVQHDDGIEEGGIQGAGTLQPLCHSATGNLQDSYQFGCFL